MSPNVSNVDWQDIRVAAEITDIQEHVNAIRDNAIEYAVSRLPAASRDEDLVALSQRQDFLSHLKCGLAKGVGNLLMKNDEQIKNVYLYEPDTNPEFDLGVVQPLDANVHLLLLVRKSSAALEALIIALDRALTQSLKESEFPVYAKYPSVLDVVPITDEDVRMRRGFATLLTSIFTPPIRVC
ncbi:MAG TPA: hypothetical protein VFI27_10170 [candidate division Zixibacteria bacterium]|nr:hypothetical protein [candidate division Zixibacteria bacterium]